ncbi:MAG TPA: hypothetical protein DEO33_06410, partial [Rikenellaceae bacterium]|nr:hypothetical protein [Rikenellaceae bacterium]
MSFKNMKISKKLGLGFGVLIFMMMALTAVGIYSTHVTKKNLDNIVNVNNVRISDANKLVLAISDIYMAQPQLILSTDENIREEAKNKIDVRWVDYDTALNNLEKLITSKTEEEILNNAKEAIANVKPANVKMMQLAMENKKSEALALYTNEVLP